MAKSLAAIQQQIQKLQDQADLLKRKEAVGVIAKIKTAIDFYGLAPSDLFDDDHVVPAKRISKAGASRKPVSTKAPKEKKAPKPAKFTDGTNFWSGHGKRPGWFKNAIETGKSPEDLAVQPA